MGAQIAFGSDEYKEMIGQFYGEVYLNIFEAVGRKGFYGIVGEEAVAELAQKLGLSQDSHLLEICSGIGAPTRFFARSYGCKTTGIDINEFCYKVALKKTQEAHLDHLVNFIHGNGLEIPCPNETFTQVFGCDSWLYFPDKAKLFQEAHRVLKPNGLMAFFDWTTGPNNGQRFREVMGGHQYYLESLEDYLNMINSAGFEILEYKNTLELAKKDWFMVIYEAVRRREEILTAIDRDIFLFYLEGLLEVLKDFMTGQAGHYYFIAKK
jgi:ubiquinone/menaquinone biosynthesis C-methylase UbiE